MIQPLLHLLAGDLGQRIGWSLVHFLWQGAAVAVVLALVLQGLRRPQARYLASCAALALMACLPPVTAALISPAQAENSSLALQRLPITVQPLSLSQVDPAFTHGDIPRTTILDEHPHVAPHQPWSAAWQSRIQPLLPFCVLAWLAGVLALSLWHVSGWMLLQRMRRIARPASAQLAEIFHRLTARLAIRHAVRLLESTLVTTPVVIGFLRPAILLPATLISGLTPDQIEAILAHELAHIRRRDSLVRMIQAAAETLLFFHPAVWWLSARITQESEHCCDEIAVQISGNRHAYAQTLAQVAGAFTPQSPLAPAATSGKLLPRLRRILGSTPHRRSIGRTTAGALAALAIVLALMLVPLAYSLAPGEKASVQSTTQPSVLPATTNPDQEALLKQLHQVLPKEWQVSSALAGVDVTPTGWSAGKGQQILLQRKGTPDDDLKRGKGGEVIIWIMDSPYLPKPHKSEKPMAQQALADQEWGWRNGHTVYLWGDGGADWKEWRNDVETALKASDEVPTTQGAKIFDDEIFIAGEVARPGAYSTEGKSLTVKQLIAAAGGWKADDKRHLLVRLVRRDEHERESISEMEFAALMSGKDPAPKVQGNDVILVLDADKAAKANLDAKLPIIGNPRAGELGEIYLMGKVTRPGVYGVTLQRITVKQALVRAGISPDDARHATAELVRRLGENKEEIIKIDLAKLFDGYEADRLLQPYDQLNVEMIPATQPATMKADAGTERERLVSAGVTCQAEFAKEAVADGLPVLLVTIKNAGNRELLATSTEAKVCELEVDGKWYRWNVQTYGAVRLQDFGPGKEYKDIRVPLGGDWEAIKAGDLPYLEINNGGVGLEDREKLTLPAGKHVVRVAWYAQPTRVNSGGAARAVSEPVTVSIGAAPVTHPATQPAAATVRLKYLAKKDSGGTFWSRFSPPDKNGISMAQAHLEDGGEFPVQDADGKTLFKVKMLSGDDARVVLEVADGKEPQKLAMDRDGQAKVTVNGEEFALVYPSVEVAATEENLKTPPTTGRMLIIVARGVKQNTTAPTTTRAAAATQNQWTVSGIVLNEKGNPAAGVQVAAVLKDSVRNGVLGITRSGSDGKFSLPLQGRDAVMLCAFVPGVSMSAGELAGEQPVELRLLPAADVRITLLEPNGKPAAGVEVLPRLVLYSLTLWQGTSLFISGELANAFAAKTDENGACVIHGLPRNSTVRLDVNDDRYAQIGYTHDVVIMPATGKTVDAKPIQLIRSGVVTGKLVNPETGLPVVGAEIHAQPFDANRDGCFGIDVTNEKGEFVLKRLRPGDFVVSVADTSLHGLAVRAADVKVVEGASVEANLVVTRGGILKGQVTDAETGKPVAKVHVGLYGPAKPNHAASIYGRVTDDEGRYEFRVPAGDQHVYVAESLQDFVETAEQQRKIVTVNEGETTEANFKLWPRATPLVKGLVVGPTGNPVGGAVVYTTGSGGMANTAQSDAQGRFAIHASSGTALRGRFRDLATLAPVKIADVKSDVEIKLAMKATFDLTTQVKDEDGKPLKDASVSLLEHTGPLSISLAPRPADAEGKVRFEGLNLDTTYSLDASANGFSETQVQVKTPKPDNARDVIAEILMKKQPPKK